MPKPRRASTTALTMHGAEPMVPDSPTPLALSALTGVGVTVRSTLDDERIDQGAGHRTGDGLMGKPSRFDSAAATYSSP